MKKLLQKINTRATRSIVLGLVLTLVMIAGTSMVSAQLQTSVVPFLGATSSLSSRIGSLTIGSSSSASWLSGGIGGRIECIHSDSNFLFASETCLDVTGAGTFGNLVVDQVARVIETVTVSTASEYSGGPGSLGIQPVFLIEDDPLVAPGAESMLIQGLGYEVLGSFSPRDLTSERAVCADENGKLTICS